MAGARNIFFENVPSVYLLMCELQCSRIKEIIWKKYGVSKSFYTWKIMEFYGYSAKVFRNCRKNEEPGYMKKKQSIGRCALPMASEAVGE
jgi:hypothetical protein